MALKRLEKRLRMVKRLTRRYPQIKLARKIASDVYVYISMFSSPVATKKALKNIRRLAKKLKVV